MGSPVFVVAEIVMQTRLCSKENFREPFGLPNVLAGVPGPPSLSPKLTDQLLNY